MKWRHKPPLLRLILAALTAGTIGCQESRYITPPTQSINAQLNSPAAEDNSNFSYNGRYLIYTSDRNSKRSVYLYDLQRRRSLQLPGLNQLGSMQSQADISADGRYIVYRSEQLGKSDIFLYDRLDGKKPKLNQKFYRRSRSPQHQR